MGEGPATVRARGRKARRYAAIAAAAVMSSGLAVGATVTGANAAPKAVTASPAGSWTFRPGGTATPIKHLVVIFDENVSFDHYFGTYPFAANTDGSTFHAKRGTPTVNGLYSKITPSGPVGPLLTSNPNLFNPTRLTHSQALTCDQDHGYTPEQKAVNGGKMDMFVQNTNTPACTGTPTTPYGAPGLVMDYYDGNTVTGLWNYAQNYAMSDNNYDTTFGPSTPGALNLDLGPDRQQLRGQPEHGSGRAGPGHGQRAEQQRPRHYLRRPRPRLRRLLGRQPHHHQPGRRLDWQEHRRPAQRQGRHLGLVPGRVRAHRDQLGRQRGLRRHPQEHRRQHRRRLLAAPRAVPVLQVHRQPQAPAAVVGGRHRPHRPGQPPVRPVQLLHHAQRREHASGQLPEGGGVPGRPPRILRPAGRAERSW